MYSFRVSLMSVFFSTSATVFFFNWAVAEATPASNAASLTNEAILCVVKYTEALRSIPYAYEIDYEQTITSRARGRGNGVAAIGEVINVQRSSLVIDGSSSFKFLFADKSQFTSLAGGVRDNGVVTDYVMARNPDGFQFIDNLSGKMLCFSTSKEDYVGGQLIEKLESRARVVFDLIEEPQCPPLLQPISFLGTRDFELKDSSLLPVGCRLIWSDICSKEKVLSTCRSLFESVHEDGEGVLAVKIRTAPALPLDTKASKVGHWIFISREKNNDCPCVLAWLQTSLLAPTFADVPVNKRISYTTIAGRTGPIPIMTFWPERKGSIKLLAAPKRLVPSGDFVFSVDPAAAKSVYDMRTKMSIEP
jgi:hypothetical protein